MILEEGNLVDLVTRLPPLVLVECFSVCQSFWGCFQNDSGGLSCGKYYY